MAIDTAEKRRSLSGIQVTLLPGVTPNASKDQEWRQQAGWGYSGITIVTLIVAFTLKVLDNIFIKSSVDDNLAIKISSGDNV